MCNLECSCRVEMDREAKLIPKLFGKNTGFQAVHDTGHKLPALFRGYFAML